MKKSTYYAKWFCMVVMIVLGAVQANAQDPYIEDFSGITAMNKLPEGWACKGSISAFEYETDKYHTGVGNGKKALAINGNTSNYLITPKLAAGPIAFYLRQYTKTYAASTKLYYCTEADGEFTIGSQIGDEATLPKNATTWTKFQYTLDKDSRIAILFDGVFDDFVAPMGIVEDGGEGTDPNPGEGTDPEPEPEPEKHLQITAFSRTSDMEANADASGNFTATFSVTVKNTGNVELTAEEVSVSITDAYTDGYNVLATATATKPLAVGATVTIPVEVTSVCISSVEKKVDFYAKENIDNTFYKYSSYPSSASVWVQPYVAKFAIYEVGGSYSLSSYYSLDFGKVTATASKSFEIRNAGAAPLEVSSISVPEGFTVDPSSFTVAGGDKQTFTVSLVPVADNYGDYSGNVVITHALGTYSFPVKGTTIDPDNIVVDFAGGVVPSNWTKIGGFSASTYVGGIGSVSSTSSKGGLQSPRITIKEGKTLSFKAEKYGTSGTSHLTLSYSANGKDWTEVKDYGTEMTASWKTFVVDEIPAGKWFIKFEGTYFDIDDITGFGYCNEPLVDLKISALGYSTFAPQYNVTIPENIEVYIVESQSVSDVVKITPITGTIAKGEGVIVKGEPEAIIIFDIVEAAEANTSNILVGTTKATELQANEAYILVEEEGQVVFSLCAEGTIAAGKAYLPVSNLNAAAPTLKIVMEDEATAIDNLGTHETSGTLGTSATSIYNLAGQKVSTGYKGIIIRNGKKMMVK